MKTKILTNSISGEKRPKASEHRIKFIASHKIAVSWISHYVLLLFGFFCGVAWRVVVMRIESDG